MSRDGEPQDPWFKKFNARRDAMDKKLADSYRQLDDHRHATDKNIADLNLHMNKRFDDFTARLEDLHAMLTARMEDSQATLTARMEQLMSSFDIFKRHHHHSRSHLSRSSCSNHGGNHERHQQPHPQDHGANRRQHLDSLCERKKPIPRKDESHIHIESKSDTPMS
jgi:hypothetical protein